MLRDLIGCWTGPPNRRYRRHRGRRDDFRRRLQRDLRLEPLEDRNLLTITPLGAMASAGVTVAESDGSTSVVEGGATDTFDIALDSIPTADVDLEVTADSQTEISLNGTDFFPSVTFIRTDTTAQTITVRAIDDSFIEGPHSGVLSISLTTADTDYTALSPLPDLPVSVDDDDFASSGDTVVVTLNNPFINVTLTLESPTSVRLLNTDNPLDSFVVSDFGLMLINGSREDNLLTIDYSNGDPLSAIPDGLGFVGGGDMGGGDALAILGSGTENAVYTPSAAPGTQGRDGIITIDDGLLTFTGLEPIDIFGMATATLMTPPDSNDTLTLANGTGFMLPGDAIRVSGTVQDSSVGARDGVQIEDVAFGGNGEVIIDTSPGVDGGDRVTINGADNAHANANLTILTGQGNDDVDVNGNVVLGGNLIVQTQDITLGGQINAGNIVDLDAGAGAIVDDLASEAANISGIAAALRAANGIGDVGDINTAIGTLAASNAAGGNIQIANNGPLTVGTVGGLAGVNGGVSITAPGTITVDEPIAATGGGDVFLSARGANTFDVQVNNTITSQDGDITINADRHVNGIAAADITTNSGVVGLAASLGPSFFGGRLQYSGDIAYNAGELQTFGFQNSFIDGVISGSGQYRKGGDVQLQLQAANTYSGDTLIEDGFVIAENDNALGATSAGTTVQDDTTLIVDNVTVAEPLTLHGNGHPASFTFGALYLRDNSLHTGPITLATDSRIRFERTSEVAGPIGEAGGTFALTIEAASGTFSQAILSNNSHTYSGPTTVTGDGTLFVTGSTPAASTVTVESTATLGGTGTIGGPLNVQGTVAPGLSPGVLNTGDVDFQAGSTFQVELGGTTPGDGVGFHDQLNVTGTVMIGANVTLDTSFFGGFLPSAGDTFTIIANDGADAVTGTFAGLADDSAFDLGNQVFTISYDFDAATGTDGGGNDVALFAHGAAETDVSLDGSGNLVVTDINGGVSSDGLSIQADTTNSLFIISDPLLTLTTRIATAIRPNEHTVIVPFLEVTGSEIIVDALDGDDALTVDFSLGDFAEAIDFRGGAQTRLPGDTLVLAGGAFADATYTFANANDGSIDITGNATITYTGLEPITSTITATNVTLDYSTVAETITVTDPGGGQTLVASTAGEQVTFNNPTGTLTINAGDTGDDTIDINGLAVSYPANLVVDGEGGLDTVNINGAVSLGAGKNLSINGETIVQTAALVIPGTTTLDAGNGSITLDNTSNDFVGALSIANADTADIVDANDLSIDSVTTQTSFVASALAGAITDGSAGEAANITTPNAVLFATTDIGAVGTGDLNTSVASLSTDSTATGGDQWINEADGLTDLNLNAGTGNIVVTAGDTVDDASGDGDDVVATTASFTLAGGTFGTGVTFNRIDTNVTNLNVDTSAGPGSQFIDEADGLDNVNMVADPNSGNIFINVRGPVLDSNADTVPDFTGVAVIVTFLDAGGNFGAAGGANEAIDTDVLGLNVTTAVSNSDQWVNETDNLRSLNIDAGSGTFTLTASGAIEDNDVNIDIQAGGAALTSVGGIGDDFEIDVDTLAASNSTTGDIVINNEDVNGSAVDGLLTIGAVGGLTGVTNFAAGGTVTVNNAGPLTIANDVIAAGNITLTASDTDPLGGVDNLTMNTGVVVSSIGADVGLNAGDDLVLNTGSTVSAAAGAIAITVDDPGTDPDGGPDLIGSSVTLLDENVLVSAGGTTITGGDDRDTFRIVPQGASTISVLGGDPTNLPGDVIDFVAPAGQTTTVSPGLTPGSGILQTSGGFAAVDFDEIERLNVAGFLVVQGTDVDDLLILTATGPDSGTFQLTSDVDGSVGGPFVGPEVGFVQLTSLAFNGLNEDDTMRINNPIAGGLIAPVGGINFDGGGGMDLLQVLGGSGSTGGYTPTGTSSGTLTASDASLAQTINFTGLEPVEHTIALDSFSITGSAGNDTINVVDGPLAFDGSQTIEVNFAGDAELIQLANKLTLTINADDGEDAVGIDYSVPADGLVNLLVNGGNDADALTITGHGANNQLQLNGDDGADQFHLVGAGQLLEGGIDGGSGNDTLDYSLYTDPVHLQLTSLGLIDGYTGAEVNGSITDSYENIDIFIANDPDLTFDGSDEDDLLDVVAATASSAAFQLTRDADGSAGGPFVGSTLSFPTLNSLTFDAREGDDLLQITNPAGGVFAPDDVGMTQPGSGVSYHAGGHVNTIVGDVLDIIGGVVGNLDFGQTDIGDGFVDYDGVRVIAYDGLETNTSSSTATNVTLNYSDAAETLRVMNANGPLTTVSSTAGASLAFNHPTGTLTVNAGDTGVNSIEVASLDDNYPATVDINGGDGDGSVNVTGTLVFGDGESITIDSFRVILPNLASGIVTSGAGGIALTATRSIELRPGSSLTTVDGDITLNANAGAVSGNFVGVEVDGSTISSSTGAISLTGTGRGTGHGVHLEPGSTVQSTGVGARPITITGTGGAGTLADGVQLVGATTSVTSVDGNIQITGSTAGGSGVAIDEADVTSTGTATLTILGTSTGTSDGVSQRGDFSQISSVDGAISITGMGGSTGDGVEIEAGVTSAISATGAATITISGDGGGTEAGLQIDSPISSATGTVTLQSDDDDISLGSGGDITSSSGTLTIDAGTSNTAVGDVRMAAGSVLDAGSGMIVVNADLDVFIHELRSSATISVSSVGGAIGRSAVATTNVTAPSAVFRASQGIGNGGGLGTAIGVLAASTTDAGEIRINNDVGGVLTIATVDGLAGLSNGGLGGVLIENAGELTITDDVTAVADIVLTAVDSAAGGEDLIVETGTTIGTSGGSIFLRGGDDVLLASGSTVDSAGAVIVEGDFGDLDAAGSVIELFASLRSGSQTTVFGQGGFDEIDLNPDPGGSGSIRLDGQGSDDSYIVQLGNLSGQVDVANVAGEGDDELTVRATDAAETLTVDATSISDGSETVTYTSELEFLAVQAFGGPDRIDVTPSLDLVIDIFGGDPAASPGDTLNFNTPAGHPITLSALGPDTGAIVAAGFLEVGFDEIEDVTVSGAITLDGGGQDDTLVLTATEAEAGDLQLTTSGVAGPTIAFSGTDSFTFNAGDGNDQLHINHPSDSLFEPASGIFYNGQGAVGDSDTLTLTGGNATTIAHAFVNANDGTVDWDGTTLTYTGLEPITDNMNAADRFFLFNGDAETITLSDAVAAGNSFIDSDLGESVVFANPTASLTIDTMVGTGTDAINIQGLDPAFDADLFLEGDADDTVSFEIGPTGLGDGSLVAVAGTINVEQGISTMDGGITLRAQNDLLGTIAGSLLTVNGTIRLAADNDGDGSGTLNLAAAIDHGLGGTTVTLAGNDGVISGIISGVGGLTKDTAGRLELAGDNTYDGTTNINAGELRVTGSIGFDDPAGAVTVAAGTTLSGTGTVNALVNNRGTVAPGLSPGILNTSDMNFADGSFFEVELGGTTPGDGAGFHDQLNVAGTVMIGSNVTLNVLPFGGFAPAPPDLFVIINNDGADAVSGTFAGLPEGASFTTASGDTFRITYAGGDGNDIVLNAGALDFGDAPAGYPVTLAEDGARHVDTGPQLGPNRDTEANGVHSTAADGDDLAGGDDEDGVVIAAILEASTLGVTTGSIDIDLRNADPASNRLDAWIDFNRDGDWGDADEQIFSNFDLGLADGVQTLLFAIPQNLAGNFVAGQSFARFRLSTAGGLATSGVAADGEVEDHPLQLNTLPVANPDSDNTTENSRTTTDVLANDTDADANDSPANFSLTSIDSVVVSGLSIDPNLSTATASLVSNQIEFNPGTDFDELDLGDTATVVIGYTMSDTSGGASSSSLTITVNGENDAPVANPDSESITENEVLMANVLANDTDVDGGDDPGNFSVDSIEVVSITGFAMDQALVSGLLTIVGNQIEFNPGTNFDKLNRNDFTQVRVAYMMSDDSGVASRSTLTIDVSGQNDTPVITDGPDTVFLEETDAALSASGTMTVNDADFVASVGTSRTVTVSGTSDRSDPAAPSDAQLLAMFTVSPSFVGGSQTPLPGTVNWNFDSGSEAFDYLARGETLILIYTITVTDIAMAADAETVTITITDNEVPVVSVEDVSVAEGGDMLFTVTLDNAVRGGFITDVTLSSVTALGGAVPLVEPEDYDNVVAQLNFSGAARETQQFTVTTLDDAIVEGTESFTVSLSASNALVDDSDTATGTITDNDRSTLRVGDATVVEGDSGTTMLSFPVTLDASVDVDVSVDYTTQDGTASADGGDFVAVTTPATLTLNAGETSGTIEITVNADRTVESDETLSVLLNNLQAGGRDVTLARWIQLGQSINGNGADENSGHSVSMSDDGRTVAIGAPFRDSGEVRVYRFDGSNWTQLGQSMLGEVGGDAFGISVSLSGDGEMVAIGAPLNGLVPGQQISVGQARVYRFDGANWIQLGQDIDGQPAGEAFGAAVSLSKDGSTLAVGVPRGGDNAGVVRVYRFDGTNWTQFGQNIAGESNRDQAGFSVSLSRDGNRLAIGSPFSGNGFTGHARVFGFDGANWIQLGQNLVGEDDFGSAGESVWLSGNGNTVVVGAPHHDGNVGQARVYRFDGSGWNQLGRSLGGELAGDEAGLSVSLSDNGNTLVLGAPFNDDGDLAAGEVSVYRFDGTNWIQLGQDIVGDALREHSGFSVSVSSDGNTLVLGAPRAGVGAGHARVYSLLTTATGTGTITDDDSLLVEFSQSTGMDAETSGGNLPQLLVTGEIQQGHSVTIDMAVVGGTATGGGEDYAPPTTVMVPAGTYNATPIPITSLSVTPDSLLEPDDTIDLGMLTGSQILAGDANGDGTTQDATQYIIQNDDVPRTAVESDTATNLVIRDVVPGGKDDRLALTIVGDRFVVTDLDNLIGDFTDNTTGTVVDIPLASMMSLEINLLEGDDQLSIDFSGAPTGFNLPVTINGGDGTDRLTFAGETRTGRGAITADGNDIEEILIDGLIMTDNAPVTLAARQNLEVNADITTSGGKVTLAASEHDIFGNCSVIDTGAADVSLVSDTGISGVEIRTTGDVLLDAGQGGIAGCGADRTVVTAATLEVHAAASVGIALFQADVVTVVELFQTSVGAISGTVGGLGIFLENHGPLTGTVDPVDPLPLGRRDIRIVLAGSSEGEGSPGQNPNNRLDVNDDGAVSPIDGLAVINRLNGAIAGGLPEGANSQQATSYVDVNGDGKVSPIDALEIINYLNEKSAVRSEGESSTGGQFAIEAAEHAAEHFIFTEPPSSTVVRQSNDAEPVAVSDPETASESKFSVTPLADAQARRRGLTIVPRLQRQSQDDHWEALESVLDEIAGDVLEDRGPSTSLEQFLGGL